MRTSPFTEEHEQLRRVVRGFAERELAPHVDEWERAGRFPDDVFRRAGELGLLGLTVPVAYGGQGADVWASVVFAEEIVRCGLASIPLALGAHADGATPPVLTSGVEEQKRRYLVPAVAGERIGCVGPGIGPDDGPDGGRVAVQARRDGRDWRLRGAGVWIANGGRADWVTLTARTGAPAPDDPGSGLSVFLVDTDLPGCRVDLDLDTVGMRAAGMALLHLDDVRVPAGALLGDEGRGYAAITAALRGERLLAAVRAVAGAQLTFERSLAYAREREVFGRPLAGFQVQKHRLVDMATEVETARRLVYDACDRWNRGADATRETAMARLAVGETAFRVADAAMQLHGGFGYSEDAWVARAWRDSRFARLGGGADEERREVVAAELGL